RDRAYGQRAARMRARSAARAKVAAATMGGTAADRIRQLKRRRVRKVLPDWRAAAADAGVSRPQEIDGGRHETCRQRRAGIALFRLSAVRVAELDGAAARHPVLIVGAGPIGMTAALVLARYGIRCVLIDRKDTFNDGSRAVCIARPSMHILERVGAVAPFVEKALGWRFGRSYYRGEQIFRLEMPHPPNEKYLPMYNLQQQYIEKFLHDAVGASNLIDMRWQSELSAIESRDDGASVRVSSPEGDYRLNA